MPSFSYGQWTTTRRSELNEIERAHTAIGGTKRGRRYATQQINQAYVVLVASQFQGYCRDLHTESVQYLVPKVTPLNFQASIRELLTQGLQLNRSNAQPGSIGADFGRFGVDFWTELEMNDPRNEVRKTQLVKLNDWRNAIAHQDFRGKGTLHLRQVWRWRTTCQRLARSFNEVMRHHLQNLTGTSPW
ncbi:MAG: HEPN domain-containing protein [Isosphaerales bacterium]